MAKKHHKVSYGWPVWVVAAATLIFGLALLIWPDVIYGLGLNLIGGALIVVGAYNIVRDLRRDDPQDPFSWGLGAGTALACAGLALLIFKNVLLSIVPILFGIAILFGGIVKLQAAFNLHRMRASDWYLTLLSAVLSCALSALVLAHPFGAGLVLIRWIGASIAIEAVQDLLSARHYNRVVTTYFVD